MEISSVREYLKVIEQLKDNYTYQKQLAPNAILNGLKNRTVCYLRNNLNYIENWTEGIRHVLKIGTWDYGGQMQMGRYSIIIQ